ncbi:DUF5615 family PIN-like protein [Sphaerotilus sp.]|uniref:DUF5615 family PIN-like protein n=1 Tax=Sphaerotilus sp. TaxID=2093942 RepID=UPI002ACE3E2B|nr:DUF5615 family PIN-like protein [Sphaerotilus sp.]MDZ7854870.1 DUF5615 family PIN-like protein [Sphaerotilus sp.]
MKIKLDENLPVRIKAILQARGHDVDTVPEEQLSGCPDASVWAAACVEGRMLITQDLDFSDTRLFAPGSHAGVVLLRLREPGAHALVTAMGRIADEVSGWVRCFVVVTDHKIRVRRPDGPA